MLITFFLDKEPATKNASEAHLTSDQGGGQFHGGQLQDDLIAIPAEEDWADCSQ